MASKPDRALFRVQTHARETLASVVVDTRVQLDRVRAMVDDANADSVEEKGRRLHGRRVERVNTQKFRPIDYEVGFMGGESGVSVCRSSGWLPIRVKNDFLIRGQI